MTLEKNGKVETSRSASGHEHDWHALEAKAVLDQLLAIRTASEIEARLAELERRTDKARKPPVGNRRV